VANPARRRVSRGAELRPALSPGPGACFRDSLRCDFAAPSDRRRRAGLATLHWRGAGAEIFLRIPRGGPHIILMVYYERRLPHLHVLDQPLFITFRLQGSLPKSRVFRPAHVTGDGKAFAAMDRLLDASGSGPSWLARPEIAGIVADALKLGESQFHRYRLHAWVVMPNHVHMLATPSAEPARWLRSMKGFTAHEANRILGATGRAFWQAETYDHLLREGEFERIRRYIEWNPVRANLAIKPEDFRWSSARAAAVPR
jgi:putative transposase